MYNELIEEKKEQFEAAIEYFKNEMTKIRTGRATPALVENILVDYYGTKTPLKQAANISIPEARQILIAPWDRDQLANIEAAIKMSNIGLSPNSDGVTIRLTLPPLNEDQRRDLVKVLNQKAEEARIALRSVREDIWQQIGESQKNGKMTEDEKFAGKDALQKVVDQYNETIESLRAKKEEEIMTV